jgi:hypothetical protein
MIENHYQLNIAYMGMHYARVKFPSWCTQSDAQMKAKQIADAMKTSFGTPLNWSFRLTFVECVGHEIEVEGV